MKNFVVLSTQRSGSTWVVDMLDSHPDVACYGELLLPEGSGRHPVGAQGTPPLADLLRERRRDARKFRRHFDAWRYLDDLYCDRDRAVGFKLMYAQVRAFPWLMAYLATRRVRVIHLIRANKLDQVLSKIVARETDQYHVLPGEQVVEGRVRVDVEELVSQMEREERKVAGFGRMLTVLPVPRIDVSYESLVSGEYPYDLLLEFVGVEPLAELTTQLTRIGSRSYADRIDNYEEVRRAVAGTAYSDAL